MLNQKINKCAVFIFFIIYFININSQPSSTNAIAKDKDSISQSNQEVSNYNDTTSYKGMKTETEVSGKSLKSDTMSGTREGYYTGLKPHDNVYTQTEPINPISLIKYVDNYLLRSSS